MYERKHQQVISKKAFAFRLLKSFSWGMLVVAGSVFIGMAGYRHYAGISWIDSFHMACLILTGMGPVVEMKTDAAKIFSSLYALYSGVAFLTLIATMLAPILHRVLHMLHVQDED